MKLNAKAAALAGGTISGVVVFLVALLSLASAGYGDAFLGILASFYPGYTADDTIAQAIIGGLYALVDGLICGYVFAWLYNYFAPKMES